MGRSNTGSISNAVNFTSYTTEAAIAANDLVALNTVSKKIFPVKNWKPVFSGVSNLSVILNGIESHAFSSTGGTSGFPSSSNITYDAGRKYRRFETFAALADDSYFYNVHADGTIRQFNSIGTTIKTTTFTNGGNNVTVLLIRKLSNDNLVILFQSQTMTGTDANNTYNPIKFVIFDKDLNLVKTETAIDGSNRSLEAIINSTSVVAIKNADIVALTAGGFAVTFTATTTTALQTSNNQRLAIFDNLGTIVSAPQTIQTWTGSAAFVSSRITQLSNANILIVCASGTLTTKGLYQAIYSIAGTQVLAMTNLNITQSSAVPEVSIMAGYYAIIWPTSSTVLLGKVFTDVGTQQGTDLSLSTTLTAGSNISLLSTWSITNDGVDFYVASANSSSTWRIGKITNVTTTPTHSSITYLGFSMSTSDLKLDMLGSSLALTVSYITGTSHYTYCYFYDKTLFNTNLSLTLNSSTQNQNYSYFGGVTPNITLGTAPQNSSVQTRVSADSSTIYAINHTSYYYPAYAQYYQYSYACGTYNTQTCYAYANPFYGEVQTYTSIIHNVKPMGSTVVGVALEGVNVGASCKVLTSAGSYTINSVANSGFNSSGIYHSTNTVIGIDGTLIDNTHFNITQLW